MTSGASIIAVAAAAAAAAIVLPALARNVRREEHTPLGARRRG
jgi:hypothetical protein